MTATDSTAWYADVRDESLLRPDGRTVAWTRAGTPGDISVLRLPGTPGSRWLVRAERSLWAERGLEVITSERPGFGASTRLPGRGFAEHADDLAAVLDHLGFDRVRVIGTSGGAPHLLALAARHPDRVAAATVLVGQAPVVEDEIEQMIELNQQTNRLSAAGDVAGVRAVLTEPYESMRADPLAGFTKLMAHAPASDRDVMTDPYWRAMFDRGVRNAFVQGIDGWVDETLALVTGWAEIDLDAVRASVTWWHAAADRNCPITAAARVVARLPAGTLRDLGDGGHFAPYRREGEILDELLARG